MTALTQLSAVAWSKQESVRGYSNKSPKSFEATGSGAAAGTTIVSTSLGAYGSDDDAFVGGLVEVVEASNGPGVGKGSPLRARVTAYDDATSPLTIESLGFQVGDGD